MNSSLKVATLLWFLLPLSASNIISAQAPGYMGKRLLIGFEAPLIGGIDRKGGDYSYKEIKPTGNSEYVYHDFSQLYCIFNSCKDISYA